LIQRLDPELFYGPQGYFFRMGVYPASLTRLIRQMAKLPGIGEKTAERLALHILNCPVKDARELAESILAAREAGGFCEKCHGLADGGLCRVCADTSRDSSLICVVENPTDMVALEKAGAFNGRYHVLMGALSPLQGIGPDDLRIKGLLARVGAGGVNEVILATNPTVEGEATAIYLARLLKPLGVRVTRIAMGIPVGSDLEYADDVTVHKALEGRREV
jgi:recombination protein RecR